MGGTIGTGLFIGSSSALWKAGPVGALLAYMWVGTLVYSVMLSLGEMATYLPMPGAFAAYASRFADRSLGFSMGWCYYFSWAFTFPIELTSIGLIIRYWKHDLSVGVFITLFFSVISFSNFLPVKVYGEFEFWAASIKVITCVGFLIFALCIDLGAGKHGYLGLKYWHEPGAFAPYIVDGSIGKFVGFWSVLIQAGFSYQGTELVGLSVGEVENPTWVIPASIRKTFYRILIFFVGIIFFIGLLIPYDSDLLLNASTDASASPFVIAAKLAGVKVLPGILNGILLTVVISAANSNVYSGSRILVGLANDKLGPKWLSRTNRFGVPYIAVTITCSFGFLAYLNLASSVASVFTWLVNLAGVAGFVCWCTISYSHICFMRALKAQGISRDLLNFQAPWQPWYSWYGLVFMAVITATQGFTCFMPFHITDFIMAYISLVIFAVLFVGHKLWFKTKPIAPEEADLSTGTTLSAQLVVEGRRNAATTQAQVAAARTGLFNRLSAALL